MAEHLYQKKIGSAIKPGIYAVTHALNAHGIKAYPSASSMIKRYIRQATKAGVIYSSQEIELSAAALMTAAAKQAQASGRRMIKVGDIRRAWEIQLRNCPGNLPPHRCMRRSILSREQELRVKLPMLEKVLTRITN